MQVEKEQRRARREPRDGLRLVTESDLDGNCRGWDGTTVFTLVNGEVWQQSSWRQRKVYLCSPSIRVWQLGGNHWLEVEGVPEILPVLRLRGSGPL
jgi:hypothetical protein